MIERSARSGDVVIIIGVGEAVAMMDRLSPADSGPSQWAHLVSGTSVALWFALKVILAHVR